MMGLWAAPAQPVPNDGTTTRWQETKDTNTTTAQATNDWLQTISAMPVYQYASLEVRLLSAVLLFSPARLGALRSLSILAPPSGHRLTSACYFSIHRSCA